MRAVSGISRIAPIRIGSRYTQESQVATCVLVRPDQKAATTQLTTQASQINASNLVGQVTIHPERMASPRLPRPSSMLQNLANWCAHHASDRLAQDRLDRPRRITELALGLVD